MKRRSFPSCVWLAGAVALVSFAGPARAADHRDAPTVQTDPAADINDIYAFVNPNKPSDVVLAMTVNPFTAPGVQAYFAPDVLYQFKIDNTGDYVEDQVIQVTFSRQGPDQTVTVMGPAAPVRHDVGSVNQSLNVRRVPTVTGPADGSTVTTSAGGMKVFAGLRDDPFFFDLIYVERFLGILPGGPVTRAPGIDFFAGMNVSAIVVELPADMLKGSLGNTLHIWGTTSRALVTQRNPVFGSFDSPPFIQEDRMGLPTINTVLIPKPSKEAFNRAVPSQDRRLFRAAALATLTAVNKDAAYSGQIADAVLPDVLTLDVTKTTGFLNGRRPQDDVIDAVLNLASKGAVTSDAVNSNDVPFLTDFPFLAPPHQPGETIPARG